MTAKPSPAILRRFRTVNDERLLALLNSLTQKQQPLIDMLPLLFHLNHPRLPGGKEEDPAPAGISSYQPGEATLRAARAWSDKFDYKPAPLAAYDIEALFLLDHGRNAAGLRHLQLWLCPRPGLTPQQEGALRRKTERVRRHAQELRLELEIATFTAEALRRGEALGVEWAGRAARRDHLLLEQFYFSAIHLGGRYPLWWLVAPEDEPRFSLIAEELLADPVTAAETVNFGGVEGLPPGEFFLTLLWRAFTALDSPYLSLPEIVMMEVQAARYPRPARLSTVYKLAIHAGDTATTRKGIAQLTLDVLKVHLRDEPQRLALVGRALETRTAHSDKERRLPLTEIQAERDQLTAALQASYRVILEQLHEHAREAELEPQEIIVLGRKLYALFEARAGKLEWFNPGILPSAVQGAISLHRIALKGGGESWQLHEGLVSPAQAAHGHPARAGRGPLELLAWAYFNGVVEPSTTVALHVDGADLTARDVQEALAALRRLFPGGRPPPPSPFELSRPESPEVLALFVNFGLSAASTIARGDLQVISDQTDALRFGALRENLISGIELLSLTSWGDIHVHRFTGRRALAGCMAATLGWAGPEVPPPTLTAFCFSAAQGALITRRMEELFNHLLGNFYQKLRAETPRHLTAVARGYYLTDLEEEQPRARWLDGLDALLAELGGPRRRFRGFVAEPQALPESPLPALYRHARGGRVQLFYRQREERVEYAVIDERGSLFQGEVARNDLPALIRFLDETLRRLFLWLPMGHNEEGEIDFANTLGRMFSGELLLFRYDAAPHGGFTVTPQNTPKLPPNERAVQLVVREDGEGGVLHTLYRGIETIVADVGEEQMLDAGAAYLSRHGLPPRIESLDAPPQLLGAGTADALQTVHYLRHQARVESALAARLAAHPAQNEKPGTRPGSGG